MKKTLALAAVLLLTASLAYAQFAGTGTTTLSVAVAAEASIQINTPATTLTLGGSPFADYAGTTNFAYKIRTQKTGGNGSIVLKVTSDFSADVNGTAPSVGHSSTTGDTLTYTCYATITTGGTVTPCSTAQTASTNATTNVAGFSEDARTQKAGDTGSVIWSLVNDPRYQTGSYNAVVTFTISAT